jgi:hypothetical protein
MKNRRSKLSRSLDLAAAVVAGIVAIWASGSALAGQPADEDCQKGSGRPCAGVAVVVAWNQRAYQIGFLEDQFLTFKTHRAYTLMHLAMHDALNAAVPRYRSYAYQGHDPRAHAVAAAAQAAHDVLLSQYPGAAADLARELTTSLAAVPPGASRHRGIALGKQAARAVLASREADGWNHPGSYTFQKGAGLYQTTPDWKGVVAQPGFRLARPFGLETPEQLRPPPPPALSSPEYAAAFEEVKQQGRAESRVRSPEQTAYALWWMEFSEGSFQRLARELVGQRGANPWQAARLFALLSMGLFDTYVAVWDSKFAYNHWRPYTAIREADHDGNPATAPDPSWQPLRPAPPFPEYVSAHAAGCAASAEVLERVLGGNGPFTMTTTTAPPGMPSRRFGSFEAAARECADSRVRIGFHFRYATDAGFTLGRAVASYLLAHHLQPVGPGQPR